MVLIIVSGSLQVADTFHSMDRRRVMIEGVMQREMG